MIRNKHWIIGWLIRLVSGLALVVWVVGVSYADDGYRLTRTSVAAAMELQGPGVSLLGAASSFAADTSVGGGYSITGGALARVASPPHAFPIPALTSTGAIALAALLFLFITIKMFREARARPTVR